MENNCKDCADKTYRSKYLHYVYMDGKSPSWTCGKHPDYTRKWGCITNPEWIKNLIDNGLMDSTEEEE